MSTTKDTYPADCDTHTAVFSTTRRNTNALCIDNPDMLAPVSICRPSLGRFGLTDHTLCLSAKYSILFSPPPPPASTPAEIRLVWELRCHYLPDKQLKSNNLDVTVMLVLSKRQSKTLLKCRVVVFIGWGRCSKKSETQADVQNCTSI